MTNRVFLTVGLFMFKEGEGKMNLPSVSNMCQPMPDNEGLEKSYSLVSSKALELEKIVSYGQATAAGQWYDQTHDEWVMLVKGTAVLRMDPGGFLTLNAGDFLTIAAHHKHRVEQCSADAIWLALHMKNAAP